MVTRFDPDTRTGRLLGYVDVNQNTGSGSLYVADFSQGEPWAIAVPYGAFMSGGGAPRIDTIGTTLFWTYQGGNGSVPCRIFYGVR